MWLKMDNRVILRLKAVNRIQFLQHDTNKVRFKTQNKLTKQLIYIMKIPDTTTVNIK